jgi:energy-coupling factor transport system ATP-binding protein
MATASPAQAIVEGRTAPPLKIAGARYQYAGSRAWVLDGIDLTVEEGEVVAVVGANDAGKSTLGLVASGLAPSVVGGRLEGLVELGGKATAKLASFDAAQRCGVLFQNPNNQLSGTAHTVWEELAFGPRNVGLGVDEIVERVETTLTRLGISDLAARDPARLSGGQAQLVALGSVLALRPQLLVLDEPTSQLDPEGTRRVGDVIERLADETRTAILVVEHKTGLLLDIADRGVLLSEGRVVASGPIRDVLADARLPELGVDPPPSVRLERALRQARASDPVVSRVLGAISGAGA